MKFPFFLVVCLVFFIPNPSRGQAVKAHELIHENSLATLYDQKLLAIDFWATWCGPCIPATEQMEVYQEIFKDEIFFISISDETTQVIEKYLKRQPINLSVYRDANGSTFDAYNVKARPHAVILNGKGKVVWEGKPGDLNVDKLKDLLKKHQNGPRISLGELVVFERDHVPMEEEVSEVEITLSEESGGNELYKTSKNVSYSGSLFGLFQELFQVSELEIIMEYPDTYVHMRAPLHKWEQDRSAIAREILLLFGLEAIWQEREMPVHQLVVTDPAKLWNMEQITWGGRDGNFLIGDSRISADNLTLSDLAKLLTHEKNQLYKYFGTDTIAHDWDFQFVYDDLMKAELMEEFGVEIRESVVQLEFVHIR